MPLSLSPEKADLARAFATALRPGQRVCITTHVNPDGDGLGSEVGLVHLLRAQGIDAVITNPSPTPPRFSFLFDDLPGVDKTQEAVRELRRADLIVVLDISDLTRLGMLIETVATGVFRSPAWTTTSAPVSSAGPPLRGSRCRGHRRAHLRARQGQWMAGDPGGCPRALRGHSDRYRRVSIQQHPPPDLAGAADLLETGVDAEQIYLEVYARAPEGRPRLFAEALQTLVVEHEYGLAWVTVPPGAIERYRVSSDDLDGVVEFPRSIEGVRMALLFREIAQGRVKVSLRSVGDVDVAAFAKAYGGGGHTKAAGSVAHRIAGRGAGDGAAGGAGVSGGEWESAVEGRVASQESSSLGHLGTRRLTTATHYIPITK